MKNSKIGWTTHTFSPWRGCTRVSEACRFCYAERDSHRNPGVLGVWGPSGTREIAAEAQWQKPLGWAREAAEAGRRDRVFCASLSDVFEGPGTMPVESRVPVTGARLRLFRLIDATPELDWLLLTKRPENIVPMTTWPGVAPAHWRAAGGPPPNVWLGTSVEDQATADARVPLLRAARASVRFLSAEPLLGHLDLAAHLAAGGIDWVIVGGESGAKATARPFRIEWAEEIVTACRAAGVPCFMKQLGTNPEAEGLALGTAGKGEDPELFPVNLRVRELPVLARAAG